MMNKDSLEMGIDGGTGLEGTKWWSRDGSDHFVVREVLISPEGFSIRTDDGRLLSGDVMETYIQSDTPVGDMNRRPEARIDPRQLEGMDAAAIVDDGKKPAKGGKFGSLKYSHPGAVFQEPKQNNRMVRKEPDPLNDPLNNPLIEEQEQMEELDEVSFGMIDRVLGKVDMNELTSIVINPIDKVDSGIVVLVNTLNINRKELRTYMANRIGEKFQEMLNESLDQYFNGLLGPDVELEDIKAEDIETEA